ncbi:MAG: precorrin-8X methylmutase [Magnetococcales bacterium]|nr:precorrin-8X methylmutase [Magnetococcales bacterium]NGZ28802.1 precorrin-8X methylmutase [Magnetococcales bacterium]
MKHDTALGRAIEQQSFDHIDAHCPEKNYPPRQWPLVRRLIHTSGDLSFNGLVEFHPAAMETACEAIRRGCPIVVDVNMVAAGISQPRLARCGNRLYHFMSDPQVAIKATEEGTTRAVQAMRHAARLGLLQGGIVAIGNAPTALLEVLRLAREESIRPALVVGTPVGFVSAAESKEELAAQYDIPWIITRGSKGGSTLTVAALHALLDDGHEAQP